MSHVDLAWQASLLDATADGVELDAGFGGVQRRDLGDGAWVDHGPGWCRGADDLFARLLAATPWAGREVRMYDRVLPEPRLTHRWRLDDGPAPPAELQEMARVLSDRYGVEFTQVGANLYRDGSDSVAWHGDRVARDLPEAIVALVSLGAVRPFRLRPTGGGASIGYLPGPGDLLVMGGSCQRTWQHSVPKTRSVGPRASIQFRHAYQR
ncbi:alpha-ketoglutarate-dependent dioxygenase AlkB [Pseudonocardia yunnanensis]|uniref:Alpha-ketoglutarate-dependent dioxygenase AlkB n=1 Tax=Pseudonocardia yunnanensis TaxID=58107 RepID=A0ABW4FDH2_9PSEU